MKTTNYRIKQLAERLSLATFTTLAIIGISALHENLEQSVINTLFSSNTPQASTLSTLSALSTPLLNQSTNESIAFICPTPLP